MNLFWPQEKKIKCRFISIRKKKLKISEQIEFKKMTLQAKNENNRPGCLDLNQFYLMYKQKMLQNRLKNY